MTATMTPLDQLSDAANFDWIAMKAGNRWDGIDFHLEDGQTVRVIPVDGKWDAGVEIYAFTRNQMVMREVRYMGPFDLERILPMIDALAPRK